jgi:hypothetical protein
LGRILLQIPPLTKKIRGIFLALLEEGGFEKSYTDVLRDNGLTNGEIKAALQRANSLKKHLQKMRVEDLVNAADYPDMISFDKPMEQKRLNRHNFILIACL